MPAVTRRQYKGAAAPCTTTNSLTSVDTSVTLSAITGWPSTAAVPFYVVIDPGTSSEEKCSATISGSTLTLTRGQDDTTAVSHSSGATIYPVFSADDADEANNMASMMTTKGDLLVTTGSAFNRLAVGTNGFGLIADSASTNGVKWGTPYNQTVSTKTASYTLVAADVGTRVVMNSASATTVTVNTSLFSAGDTLTLLNIGAGTCTITAGTATVSTASSLALAQFGGGTLYFTSAGVAIFFSQVAVSYGTATGGSSSSITDGGIAYTLLTFTTSGTLTVTKSGLFDYLIVAGGAAGGGDNGATAGGGGGGGGAIMTGTAYFTANKSITIGAGGAANAHPTNGSNGSPSVISDSVALGGGGGDSFAGANSLGTGGGGSGRTAGFAGTAYASGAQGKNGGAGTGTNAGGGGGGGQVVGVAASGNNGGAGGAGLTTTFAGSSQSFGGGGGGGAQSTGAGGAGGTGGGGAGGLATATAGTANTGGGGGGARTTASAGGSGVVYIRFKS